MHFVVPGGGLESGMLAASPLNLLSIKAHLTLFSMIRIGFHLKTEGANIRESH